MTGGGLKPLFVMLLNVPDKIVSEQKAGYVNDVYKLAVEMIGHSYDILVAPTLEKTDVKVFYPGGNVPAVDIESFMEDIFKKTANHNIRVSLKKT